MPNIDFSTTNHEEITTQEQVTPLLKEFLNDLNTPEEAQKNAEDLQGNKALLEKMAKFAKSHLDKTVLNTYTIQDDTQAKELIAYHELQSNHPYTIMPPTEIERKEQATQILNEYKGLKEYEQQQHMHLNFKTKQLQSNPTAETIPYGIDSIPPCNLESGLMSVLSKFGLTDAISNQKKEQHLYKLFNIIGGHRTENQNIQSIRAQLDAELSLGMQGHRLREAMSTVDKTQLSTALTDYYTKQPDQFNTITTHDQFLVKELFCGLMSDAIYDPKQRESSIGYRDLQRDNGIYHLNNQIQIKEEKLETDNVTIENAKIINSVTKKTIDLSSESMQQAETNRDNREKGNKLIRTTYSDKRKEILGLHQISEKEYWQMEYDERKIYESEIQQEFLKKALTDNACFVAAWEQQYQSNRNGDIGGDQGKSINAVLSYFNTQNNCGIDLDLFDCENRRTLLTATKNERNENIFQLQQGPNTITIGLGGKLTADIKAPPSREELETTQSNLDNTQGDDKFGTTSVTDLLEDSTITSPGLRRALHAVQRPKTQRDGVKGINRSGLDLTAGEITNLSKLLTQEDYKNQNLHLDISNNNLFNIPKSLLEQQNVQHLDLANNRISYLPATANSNLKSLNLNHNGAGNIYNINKLTKLESIHIDNNNLSQLPALPAGIQELTAANNSLHEINFSTTTSLTKIYLGNNKLTSLPATIANLALEELSVGDNQLATLPEPIASADTLKHISVRNNPLTEFPLTKTYTALKTGHFTNTNITTFPANILQLAPNAEHISYVENVLSGAQAKKQFLDGSLSRRGYDLTKGGAKQLQSLFEDPNTESIKYAQGKGDNPQTIEQELKRQLQVDNDQQAVTVQKANKTGGYSLYLFAAAQSPKDYIDKKNTLI